MQLEDINKSVETALAAFNEYKGLVEGIKTKQTSIEGKIDAFDVAKLEKLEKSMGDAIELTQKAEARAKAAEDAQKALEVDLAQLKTAFARPGNPATGEEKAKELSALRTKAFNEFARSGGDRQSFGEYLAKRADSEPELKALSVGSDPNGGYLVMPEFGGIIQTRVFESSPIRALATVTSIGTDALELIQDNDEAVAGWVSETAARPTTGTPQLGKLNFPTEEMYAKPKVTQKLLEDASIDVEAWLMGKVADIFARKEATAFVSGIGTGQPRGLLTYTAGTTISSGQIEQVASTDANTIKYDGLVLTQNALKEPYQPNATWLFRRATLGTLMLLKDGNGTPIFNMDYNRNAGIAPATLLGQPVRFAADMPAVAPNALAVAYGDIREAYQVVDRRGIQVLRDPYSSKPFVEFYTTRRVGGGVKNFEAVKIMKIAAS